jgi:hypothetical protein
MAADAYLPIGPTWELRRRLLSNAELFDDARAYAAGVDDAFEAVGVSEREAPAMDDTCVNLLAATAIGFACTHAPGGADRLAQLADGDIDRLRAALTRIGSFDVIAQSERDQAVALLTRTIEHVLHDN